jgi:hypothetical protein
MNGLARIFFQVNALQTHQLARTQAHTTARAERARGLADLVALRQITIEVVLAIKVSARRDAAAQSQSSPHGQAQRFAIQDGQGAWLCAAHRTHARVGSCTKLDGTAKGGVVIGISDQMKIPVKYIGVGEKMEDLQLFDRKAFVETLFK